MPGFEILWRAQAAHYVIDRWLLMAQVVDFQLRFGRINWIQAIRWS